MSPPTARRRMLLPLLLAGTLAVVAAWVTLLLSEKSHPSSPTTASVVACRQVAFAGHSFTVVPIDLDQADLRLFWRKPDGSRYGNFRTLRADLEQSGRQLLFATNAGIFDPSHTPLGLHVERARVLVPLNSRDGVGNFYLKPNGVFLIDAAGDAHVVSTEDYPAPSKGGERDDGVRLATQSGPLLVRAGRLHPGFHPGSTSLAVRSGVGVASPRQVAFALSDEPVNFETFARLFRDGLGCPDALYLDGTISRFDVSGLPGDAGDAGDAGAENFAGMLAALRR